MLDSNYVVILATLPTAKNEQDGMIQRELAIDSIMRDVPRVYVDKIYPKISWRHLIKQWLRTHGITRKLPIKQLRSPLVYIFHYISVKHLHSLLKRASLIYVHSLYNLRNLPVSYIEEFKDKIVLDIHGCVVEENIFKQESQSEIDTLAQLEAFAFPKLYRLITVTQRMVEFYQHKYSGLSTEFIILPIFTTSALQQSNRKKPIKPTVVYSGNAQPWQNVDKMISSIRRTNTRCNFKILTPQVDIFTNLLQQSHIQNVVVKTVPSSQLKQEYISCDLGYILRDNIIVNTVACPTKLIEYLTYGIIPIVLQPEIGDFNKLSYSYVLNSDLENGIIPSWQQLSQMRTNNYHVLDKLCKVQQEGKNQLRSILPVNLK